MLTLKWDNNPTALTRTTYHARPRTVILYCCIIAPKLWHPIGNAIVNLVGTF